MLFLPNARAILTFDSSVDISIEVEFSPRGEINHLKFDFPESLNKSLCQEILYFQDKAKTLTLKKALELPWKEESYLPVSHWLVLKAYENWVGDIPCWEDREERLLCRCFGVSIEEVKAFCRQRSNPTLRDVADTLRAGAGCSTCLDDLKELLISLRGDQMEDSLPLRIRIGGRSPLEVLVEAHTIAQNFFGENPDIQGSIEFLQMRGRQLFFNWNGTEGPQLWMADLEKELTSHFQDELVLIPCL